MGFLWVLLVGLVVGALAKLLMPGRDPGGIIITMLLGVAGAFVASFVGKMVGLYDEPGSAPGLLASVLGSMLLLFIYRMVVRRRAAG
jgi:uncharacterized membrane protein YeaQ/YmgE (transglycosylase-associated protein family)